MGDSCSDSQEARFPTPRRVAPRSPGMKAVARGYFWWPGLDRDSQNLGDECQTCLAVKHSPTTSVLHPWEWPPRPWQQIHIDFARPFQGANFLVAVDARSIWPKVEIMGSTNHHC